MKADAILQSDVLDIIFDRRNKSYGAYTLRRFYNKRLYKALGATFTIAAALLTTAILMETKKEKISTPDIVTRVFSIPPAKPAAKEIKPVTVPQKPKALAPVSPSQTFVAKVSIIDDNRNATKLADNLDSLEIASETNNAGKPEGNIIHVEPGTGSGGTGGTGTEPPKPVDKITPRTTADVMPAFPGGEQALLKFLQRNLQNPKDLEEGEEVLVRVSFVVGYDGTLKSFDVLQDGGAPFNNEVIRVLKKMPAWTPGKSAGENVSVYYSLPVKFVAGNE